MRNAKNMEQRLANKFKWMAHKNLNQSSQIVDAGPPVVGTLHQPFHWILWFCYMLLLCILFTNIFWFPCRKTGQPINSGYSTITGLWKQCSSCFWGHAHPHLVFSVASKTQATWGHKLQMKKIPPLPPQLMCHRLPHCYHLKKIYASNKTERLKILHLRTQTFRKFCAWLLTPILLCEAKTCDIAGDKVSINPSQIMQFITQIPPSSTAKRSRLFLVETATVTRPWE